ncbi:MAG: hypothetical protein JW772_02345 [Candidatus Diapherotrites archaeon]|nr:hypothetical protein [Candidatus Diapherotrites archaeon]
MKTSILLLAGLILAVVLFSGCTQEPESKLCGEFEVYCVASASISCSYYIEPCGNGEQIWFDTSMEAKVEANQRSLVTEERPVSLQYVRVINPKFSEIGCIIDFDRIERIEVTSSDDPIGRWEEACSKC